MTARTHTHRATRRDTARMALYAALLIFAFQTVACLAAPVAANITSWIARLYA